MQQIIFFDLGNTLFYREIDHKNSDIQLISNLFNISKSIAEVHISNTISKFPAMYDFSVKIFKNLDEEDTYVRNFFVGVSDELGLSKKQIEVFLHNRQLEIRYKLYSGALKILKNLYSHGYKLGIISNGRPSRRRILEQLNIRRFFDEKLIFISGEVGLFKPDKAMFEFVASKLETKGNVFLCDDERTNLNTASSLSWKTILVDHNITGFNLLKKMLLDPHSQPIDNT